MNIKNQCGASVGNKNLLILKNLTKELENTSSSFFIY